MVFCSRALSKEKGKEEEEEDGLGAWCLLAAGSARPPASLSFCCCPQPPPSLSAPPRPSPPSFKVTFLLRKKRGERGESGFGWQPSSSSVAAGRRTNGFGASRKKDRRRTGVYLRTLPLFSLYCILVLHSLGFTYTHMGA